jgi:hypothetical protein
MISAAEWQLENQTQFLNELMFGTTALLVIGYRQQGF